MLTVMPDAFHAFLEDDDGGDVVMLNLLRFRPDGGREQYDDYLAATGPIGERHGIEIVYFGDGLPALSAEPGQAWDAVLIVRYPSRAAFKGLVSDPDYAATAGPLREGALVEAVLQPMRTRA